MPLHHQPAEIPVDDRLPTFAEVENFDAAAAWDRLSPSLQRELGILAARYVSVGMATSYVWCAHEANPPKDWTPYQIEAGNWPKDQINRAYELSDEALTALGDVHDRIWPDLFRWTAPRWTNPVIRQVA